MIVKKRKDTGKWGYQHYAHGKNFRRFVWNTRDEAQKAAEDLLSKLRREVNYISSPSIPFIEAADKFMEYSARIGKSENRLRGLYSNFKSILIPFFGNKRIKDITHLDIDAFIDSQLKRDIKKKTITHYVTDLNALLNWALLKEEMISVNPMSKVVKKRIRPEKIIKRGFTKDEIKKCEACLTGAELYFFQFLLFTGARLKEALFTRWEDIDYENREVIIRGTKTEGSLRTMEMCNSLYDVLKGLEAYKTDSPYIFHHSDGKPILRRDKLFKRIKNKTGIKITAKDLRDVFASTITMGSGGNVPDIKTVSELLGHTNITTTQKYLFSLKQKKMKAVSVLDDIYGSEMRPKHCPEISPENEKDSEESLSSCNDWWRCLDLNQGHYGYEPYALTN